MILDNSFPVIPMINLNVELQVYPGQGWGFLSQFLPFRYFPNFPALLKHNTYWILHLYLTGATATQLWWHLSNINVIQSIWQLLLQVWKIFLTETLTNSYSNPHPRSLGCSCQSNLPTYLQSSCLGTCCEIAPRWMPQNLTYDKSTLVQVMA